MPGHKIERIRLSNFKSFEDVDLELGDFSVLIGANASGKSNFIQIFKFLSDIAKYDLDNAISMQGGADYLTNTKLGTSRPFSVEVVVALDSRGPFTRSRRKQEKWFEVRPYEATYKLTIALNEGAAQWQIREDTLVLECSYVTIDGRTDKEIQEVSRYEISITHDGRKLRYRYSKIDGQTLRRDEVLSSMSFIREIPLPGRSAILATPLFGFPFVPLQEFFLNLVIYNFDPRLPKKAVPITGKSDLEDDGSNLAIVLNNILEDKENHRKFSNIMRELLPFVEHVDVDRFADQSMLFTLREMYTPEVALPASLISDGTINITALIVALYFERKPVMVIEEPERNIHPFLISRVVNMLREASENKQVIVTTHNPEMVRHVAAEDLLLISRNKEGYSTICRPTERAQVKAFLEDEIGIEELYVAGLLEG